MKKKVAMISAIAVAIIAVTVAVIINFNKVKWDYNVNVSEELTKYQDYWLTTSAVMKCEDGYYFIKVAGDNNLLYHIDAECKECDIICEAANCRHNSQECRGLWQDSTASNFQYCNGYIFYTQRVGDNSYLFRAKPDGSDRTKLMKIGNFNDVYTVQNVYVHGNHVFVEQILKDGSNVRFVDFDMEGAGKYGMGKTVRTVSFNGGSKVILDINDDKILYQNCDGHKSTVYEYDITTGSDAVAFEIDGVCGYVSYFQNGYILTQKDGVFFVEKDGNVKKLDESAGITGYVNTYGDYAFVYSAMFDENDYIDIYDNNLNKVSRIAAVCDGAGTAMPCYFGDDDKLFSSVFGANKIYVCDKKAAIKGDVKWQMLVCK